MRIHSIFIITSLAASIVPCAAFAEVHHGIECNPETPSDAPGILRDNFGIHNPDTSSAHVVHCAGVRANTGASGTAQVIVYDRSNSQPVACTFMLTDGAGDILFSASADTGPPINTSSSPMTLTAPMPFMIGVFLSDIRCTIPPRDTSHVEPTFSHVTSYMLP